MPTVQQATYPSAAALKTLYSAPTGLPSNTASTAAATPCSAFERVCRPTPLQQLGRRIPHDKRLPGKSQHLYIVVIVTNGHDLLAPDAPVFRPALQRVALGAAGIEYVHNRQIPAGYSVRNTVIGSPLASSTRSACCIYATGPQNIAWIGSDFSASSIGITNSIKSRFFSSQR